MHKTKSSFLIWVMGAAIDATALAAKGLGSGSKCGAHGGWTVCDRNCYWQTQGPSYNNQEWCGNDRQVVTARMTDPYRQCPLSACLNRPLP